MYWSKNAKYDFYYPDTYTNICDQKLQVNFLWQCGKDLFNRRIQGIQFTERINSCRTCPTFQSKLRYNGVNIFCCLTFSLCFPKILKNPIFFDRIQIFQNIICKPYVGIVVVSRIYVDDSIAAYDEMMM